MSFAERTGKMGTLEISPYWACTLESSHQCDSARTQVQRRMILNSGPFFRIFEIIIFVKSLLLLYVT